MVNQVKGTVKKKRNPQDATLRNIRALKKQFETLKARVIRLELAFLFGAEVVPIKSKKK